jgi:hypothetical protein
MINEDNYQPHLVTPHQINTNKDSIETIRNTFENRSISDYKKLIKDYDLLCRKYKRTVKWDMRVQFVKKFFRFSLSTTFGILKVYFGKQKGKIK